MLRVHGLDGILLPPAAVHLARRERAEGNLPEGVNSIGGLNIATYAYIFAAQNGLSRQNDKERRRRGEPLQKWVMPLGFVRKKPEVGHLKHLYLSLADTCMPPPGWALFLATHEMGGIAVLCSPARVDVISPLPLRIADANGSTGQLWPP